MGYLLNIMNELTSKDIIFIILLLTFLIITIILLTYIKTLKKTTNEIIEEKIINKEDIKEEIIEEQPLTDITDDIKKLEELANKQHVVNLTPYEEEQEEKAIISYDELLQKSSNVSIGYSSYTKEDDILVKQVDLNNTGKIELDPIKKALNSKFQVMTYEHEEEFLNALKELKNMLN